MGFRRKWTTLTLCKCARSAIQLFYIHYRKYFAIIYSRTLKRLTKIQPLISLRLNNAKLWILMHYKVLWVMSISREICYHQMNFRFWNHNRFETVVIGFVRHRLPATFTLFPDTTNWHHGVLWQLNNHLHTTHKSYILLSQLLYFFGSCKPSG